MKQTFLTYSILLLSASLCTNAQTKSTTEAISKVETLGTGINTLALDNPAIMQFKQAQSLSHVNLSYFYDKQSQAVDRRLGDGDKGFSFDAKTYIVHKNTRIWGHADYINGKQTNVRWNETSDMEMLYPYLMADSTGGNMKYERYCFGGGFSQFNGKFGWGGSLDYNAGLYHRSVDPRPKNITSLFIVSLGGIMKVTDGYVLGIGGEYTRYKQSNDVTFYSELGQDKLYHLIGMANDYVRFAGQSYSTTYSGNKGMAMVNFYPTRLNGFNASVKAGKMTIENVLISLNKLPIAKLSDVCLQAEAGFRFLDSYAVRGFFDWQRRHGEENIFGDPQSGSYPQIASLNMYKRNRVNVGVELLAESRPDAKFYWGIQPKVVYSHHNQTYATPISRERINTVTTSLKAQIGTHIGRTFNTFSVNGLYATATSSELSLGDTSQCQPGLVSVVQDAFLYRSHANGRLVFIAETNIPVKDKCAICVSVNYTHGWYYDKTYENSVTVSAGVKF